MIGGNSPFIRPIPAVTTNVRPSPAGNSGGSSFARDVINPFALSNNNSPLMPSNIIPTPSSNIQALIALVKLLISAVDGNQSTLTVGKGVQLNAQQKKTLAAENSSEKFKGSGLVDWDNAPANLKQLKSQIQNATAKSGVPESIIAGTIWTESRGNINVEATDGGTDQGLMQIDNTTYNAEVAGQNGLPKGNTPTNPAQNILAGATYLSTLKQKFGTWDLALRAYNSGENGVDKNNPNATPAGTGIPEYVTRTGGFVASLEGGNLNPNT